MEVKCHFNRLRFHGDVERNSDEEVL